MVLSNPGQDTLEWELATHGVGVRVTPASGTLAAQGLVKLTVSFASAQTQARAAAYLGNITLSAISGVCICRPQTATVAVIVDVAASASANASVVALSDADAVSAAGTLEFGIEPIDGAGTPILDASDIAYVAFLDHP